MTEMRLPQKGSRKTVESFGGIAEYGNYIGGAATVWFRADIVAGKKRVEMRGGGFAPVPSNLSTANLLKSQKADFQALHVVHCLCPTYNMKSCRMTTWQIRHRSAKKYLVRPDKCGLKPA